MTPPKTNFLLLSEVANAWSPISETGGLGRASSPWPSTSGKGDRRSVLLLCLKIEQKKLVPPTIWQPCAQTYGTKSPSYC